MSVLTGSSFWILGLVVILNSIDLSSQSGTPRPQLRDRRRPESPAVPEPHTAGSSFRKVRCPKPEQITVNNFFKMQDRNSNYVNCTPEKILLALGPMIIGYIMDGYDNIPAKIQPICDMFGKPIVYDESKDNQYKVGSRYLRQFGVFADVPNETLNEPRIDPFGVCSPRRSSVNIMHAGCSPVSHSTSDSESSSSSSSSDSSHSYSRLSAYTVRKALSRLFTRSSHRPSSSSSNIFTESPSRSSSSRSSISSSTSTGLHSNRTPHRHSSYYSTQSSSRRHSSEEK